jgi:uncharacterized protein
MRISRSLLAISLSVALQIGAGRLPACASLADDPAWAAYDDGRYVTALAAAKEAAAQGQPAAHTLVGRILNEGLGVPRDAKGALEWYRKGAELGDANAQLALGLLYVRGEGVPADPEVAAQWFEKSAALGNAKANYNLGVMYAAGRGRPADPKRAVELLEMAAKADEMQAAYDLAQLYADPLGYQVRDVAKAVYWMGKAADSGLVEAQLDFAMMLFKGRGLPADRKRAAWYFTIAAERGNPIAQNRLAHLYAEGVVYKRDLRVAAKWHLLARRAGVEDQKLDLYLATITPDERKQATLEAAQWADNRLGP